MGRARIGRWRDLHRGEGRRAVGRDEVGHLDVALDELAGPLQHHVGGAGAALVLAQVLAPRVDLERLDEAVGVGEVAVQPPLRRPRRAGGRAPRCASSRRTRRGPPPARGTTTVTSTGPALGSGSSMTIGAVERRRAQIEVLDGTEAPAAGRGDAGHEHRRRQDVGDRDAPAGDAAPQRAAERRSRRPARRGRARGRGRAPTTAGPIGWRRSASPCRWSMPRRRRTAPARPPTATRWSPTSTRATAIDQRGRGHVLVAREHVVEARAHDRGQRGADAEAAEQDPVAARSQPELDRGRRPAAAPGWPPPGRRTRACARGSRAAPAR